MSELEQQLRRTARVARTNWLVTLYNNAADRIAELEANQAKRDFEMQAKGAQLIVEEIEVMSSATSMRGAAQRIYATLRKQAGDL
jgi:hypothetical protein